MKKIISILTVCLMLLSFVPVVFSYAEVAPTYTISNHKYQDGNQYWCVPGQPATITASDGFTISRTANGEFKETLIQTAYQDPLASIFLKSIETGEVEEIRFNHQINWDQNPPGAEITLNGNYSSFTFTEINMGDCDTYFMEPVTIDIAPSDTNGSGVARVQYIVSDYPLDLEDLETLESSKWQTYNDNELVINTIGTYIVYVKVTDNVGNVKYINSCLFAYGGALRYVNDQPNYIDYNGTTKTPVNNDTELFWIKEDSGGQTTLFALDNSRDSFSADSILHVRGIDPFVSSDEWNTYYNMLDDTYRDAIEKDHIYMFDVGVTDPNGDEITEFEPGTDLYVALPDGWDPDDVEAAYIKPGTDEALSETITNDEIVSRNGEWFVKLSLNHFSTYVIYDKLSDSEKAAANPVDKDTKTDSAKGSSSTPKTGDDTNTALWFIIACAALTACITIRRKA